MSYRTDRRHRQIATKGRPMIIRRPGQSAGVTIQAYAPPAQAAQIINGMGSASFIAQTMADALTAHGLPAKDDTVQDGPKAYTLTDATPVYDGPTLCGWTLIAAGGESHDDTGSLV
ncbi:hypothetical protein [Acetobacter orleanensis]|uniref:Uncharacterized protein n=1 Tax=Acetobacter orleanensis TaxID=104099 RepID=A0A4Y3TLK2_9PROT|nr:hypothetical protein [Acetobacter orleanensis]KXV62549.1 hypothetical protein AD949_10565 [Acetobacter orleanensis]PCD80011.1 hypothetical protein CO710_03910 [Acetobacter orleanensis]GAN68325.1 hypothetical protein Abol_015_164 [Acetobacter orleanensis JCM 7639]GBR29833.1 hypothetical protein AA0473_2123 [Acetobacter orleanensis NRIC 0473]GEB83861.1 hypothetical protein AOR01nite_23380 [Acetobacter orleanensis]